MLRTRARNIKAFIRIVLKYIFRLSVSINLILREKNIVTAIAVYKVGAW